MKSENWKQFQFIGKNCNLVVLNILVIQKRVANQRHAFIKVGIYLRNTKKQVQQLLNEATS